MTDSLAYLHPFRRHAATHL